MRALEHFSGRGASDGVRRASPPKKCSSARAGWHHETEPVDRVYVDPSFSPRARCPQKPQRTSRRNHRRRPPVHAKKILMLRIVTCWNGPPMGFGVGRRLLRARSRTVPKVQYSLWLPPQSVVDPLGHIRNNQWGFFRLNGRHARWQCAKQP